MTTKDLQALRERIRGRLGVGERRLQQLTAEVGGKLALSPRAALLWIAKENGIPIGRYATPEDYAEHRDVRSAPIAIAAPSSPAAGSSRASRGSAKKAKPARKPNTVWVIAGRDSDVEAAVGEFLESLGLKVISFNEALGRTHKGAPYILQILRQAFKEAAAVVAVFTPDELAKLKPEFRRPSDPETEFRLRGQARQNVVFEAGMAFASHPDNTIIVHVGEVRPMSDLGGLHVLHLDDTYRKRDEFLTKLKAAGCKLNTTDGLWKHAGNFSGKRQRR